ncbi:hypothetical protein ACFL3D_00885 [Candidatus Omnitrophota bacterium]
MKIIGFLISLAVLAILVVVITYIFFNVKYDVNEYDVLIYSRNEAPERFVGLRYKDEFMIHVFKREKKTVGDGVDQVLDWWNSRKTEEDNLVSSE